MRRAREAAGMSAIKASRALGYKSPNVVTKWENGDNRPDPDDVARLADIYGVAVQTLFADPAAGAPAPASDVTDALNAAPTPSDTRSGGLRVGQGDDQADWKAMAQQLMEIMRMRESNEKLRIETVEGPDARARADLAATIRGQAAQLFPLRGVPAPEEPAQREG